MSRISSDLKNKEFSYQDITLIPYRLPDFEREEVDLSSYFTKKIKINTPLVSSPMDTVTESKMAILLAVFGGIGVIHYNFSTIEEQIEEVKKVKKFETVFIKDPICLSPTSKIKDVYKIKEKYGFSSVPITENGKINSKLLGLVTERHIRYQDDKEISLRRIMTKTKELIMVSRKETLDKNDIGTVNKLIKKYNLDILPIIDENLNLVALVTDSDLEKNRRWPLATKDKNKQLRVFIAVEARLELAKERIKKGKEVGVDGIVIDAGIVYKEQLKIAKFTKKNFPHIEVVIGNICSPKMVREIMEKASSYVDALRIGVGPGAACITQEELGVGRLQASTLWNCTQEVKKLRKKYGFMPLIADGGIKILENSSENFGRVGDITKALTLGVSTVMIGSIFAGLDEAPGEKIYDEKNERMVKKYRGMGSYGAMEKRAGVRYKIDKVKIKVPEGKEIKVPYRGSGYDFLPNLIAGIKQSFQKQGFRNIPELQKYAEIKPFRFVV